MRRNHDLKCQNSPVFNEVIIHGRVLSAGELLSLPASWLSALPAARGGGGVTPVCFILSQSSFLINETPQETHDSHH